MIRGNLRAQLARLICKASIVSIARCQLSSVAVPSVSSWLTNILRASDASAKQCLWILESREAWQVLPREEGRALHVSCRERLLQVGWLGYSSGGILHGLCQFLARGRASHFCASKFWCQAPLAHSPSCDRIRERRVLRT